MESEEDPDTVVVLITIPRVSEEDLEADTEDAEEPALVGEPEGGADEGGESEG